MRDVIFLNRSFQLYTVHSDLPKTMTSRNKLNGHEWMTFILLVICLLVCMGISALYINLSIRLSSLQDQLDNSVLTNEELRSEQKNKTISCQPCFSLKLGPFPEDSPELKFFLQVEKNGVIMCCARNAEENAKLIELLVQRKLAEMNARGVLNCTSAVESTPVTPPHVSNNTTTFAHLLAGKQNNTEADRLKASGYSPIRNWLSDHRLSQVRGVKQKNGRIVVSRQGTYMVYSHVQFSDIFTSSQKRMHQFVHQVCRFNILYPHGGEECLMQAEITRYLENSPHLLRNPSFLSGIFTLKKNDELYVRVSNTTSLSFVPKSTFFGILKLT